MSSSPHPLGLPEIREHVAKFLSRHELTICARVSRNWNKSFQPWVWRRVKLVSRSCWTTNTKDLPLSIFIRNADFIQKLDGFGDVIGHLEQVTCSKLKALTIRHWDCESQSSVIYQHRRTLTELSFDIMGYSHHSADSEKFNHGRWEAAASCPLLQKLTVVQDQVAEQDWSLWSSIWSQVRSLRLILVKFQIPSSSEPTFSSQNSHRRTVAACHLGSLPKTKIKQLTLIRTSGLTCLEDELEFLRLCPDLERFEWIPASDYYQNDGATVGNQTPIGDTLAEIALLCPKLSRLLLTLNATREDEIIPFLDTRAGGTLEELTLDTSIWFGEPSWRIIQSRHWSSLRILRLHRSGLMKGVWVQEIMCGLPSLEVFTAPWLQDIDIENDPRPWICLGLTQLTLCIDMVKSSSQSMIMERLADLTNLRYLDLTKTLTMGKNSREVSDLVFLQLSLSHGLGLLSTMRNLESLMLFDTNQDMNENDARWILEHWPRLKTLCGTLNSSSDVHSALWAILYESGVGFRQEIEMHIVE